MCVCGGEYGLLLVAGAELLSLLLLLSGGRLAALEETADRLLVVMRSTTEAGE